MTFHLVARDPALASLEAKIETLPPRLTRFRFPEEASYAYYMRSETVRFQLLHHERAHHLLASTIEEVADRAATALGDCNTLNLAERITKRVTVAEAHYFSRSVAEFISLCDLLCDQQRDARLFQGTLVEEIYNDTTDCLELLRPQLEQSLPVPPVPTALDWANLTHFEPDLAKLGELALLRTSTLAIRGGPGAITPFASHLHITTLREIEAKVGNSADVGYAAMAAPVIWDARRVAEALVDAMPSQGEG